MHPLFDRIMAGDICPAEINQYNAENLLAQVKATDPSHSKDTCKQGKYCVHIYGEPIQQWAEFLLAEMSDICTCETHK